MLNEITLEAFFQIFISGCVFGFLVGFSAFWLWLRSVWNKVKKEIEVPE
jgi:hypothetical protein